MLVCENVGRSKCGVHVASPRGVPLVGFPRDDSHVNGAKNCVLSGCVTGRQSPPFITAHRSHWYRNPIPATFLS